MIHAGVHVRSAKDDDLPAINEIYNHYVRDSHVTFDLEPTSMEARREWFEPDAQQGRIAELSVEDLHAERFRGIRPALGYPACPDHSQKRDLFALLGADTVDIGLTESWAMTPAASVSGLIFAHPSSRYFTVGRLGRDQVEDYARRKGVEVAEVEQWLRPNLAYDPEA